MEVEIDDIWTKAAPTYDQQEWVNHLEYLSVLLSLGQFQPDNFVLDVGTGTGKMAHNISPIVGRVIGIDTSDDMLDEINWCADNELFFKWDVRDPLFKTGMFDRVIARGVFHHVVRGTKKAMDECYRILKRGGLMLLAEGVPPSRRTKKDFEEILGMKEERLTWMEPGLRQLMEKSGFKKIRVAKLTLRGISVKKWLENAALPEKVQLAIYNKHRYAPPYFQHDYNMKKLKNDCLIDMRVAIAVGRK